MAQTGFTPIALYYSSTASATPTAGNLVAGELAINTADGKLFYKDPAGTVQVLATKDSTSGSFVNLAYTGTLTGGTGVVNLGSGQFYKDASGNVGIGTASPTQKLDVNNGANSSFIRTTSTQNASGFDFGVGGASDTNAYIYNRNNTPIIIATNATERMRIDSSGNVGIGTASPPSKLSVQPNASFGLYGSIASASDNYPALRFNDGSNVPTTAHIQAGTLVFDSGASSTERMRIDTSGNLLVSKTAQDLAVAGFQVRGDAPGLAQITRSGGETLGLNRLASDGSIVLFYRQTSQVGSISVTGSATAYNTSSDYRLKENVAPMIGALATVQKLKPVTYKWKLDGSDGQGFIAHELQEVVPECVTGEKDGTRIEKYEISPAIPAEIDADGKVIKEAVEAVMGEREVPNYQGIDTSFLVATLTAAIQELNAKVTALEEQVIALSVK